MPEFGKETSINSLAVDVQSEIIELENQLQDILNEIQSLKTNPAPSANQIRLKDLEKSLEEIQKKLHDERQTLRNLLRKPWPILDPDSE